MANIVGDAYVIVRAITAGVERDIKNGFKNTDRVGRDAGDSVGRSFRNGFTKNSSDRNIFSGFLRESEKAKAQFSSLTRTGYTLAPIFTAIAGAIGSAATALISLVSIIGAATLPTLAALAGGLMAAGQAALTLKLAFSGVAKAIQAGNKVAKGSTADTKALEKAKKALEKAQRELAQTYEDAGKKETKALRDITDAEKELHLARLKAQEDIQQLQFDSEDAAIAEQKAAIELEKARETLARVSDLPPNSRARKEAELAFAQADLNYRRAIDKNNDLKKQEAKNAAMGNTLEAQVDGQENVIAALRAKTDAEDAYKETVLQNDRAIANATESRDQAAEAVKNLEDGGSAANAYADALSDLSAEAQHFVKYIVGLRDEFKALKAAAGEKLFPQLEDAIQNLVDNLFPKLKPLLSETGDVLGRVAKKFSDTITSAENLKRLESIWHTNNKFIEKMGDVLNNLYEVLLILVDAAKPLIDAFGDWAVKASAAWKETLKAEEASGKLAEKMQIAKGILSDLGTIFGNTFKGMGNIISANVGPGSGGQIYLDYLKDVTEKFKNLQTIDGKPLKEFFAGAAVNGTKLLDLLGKIAGIFIKMADNPELGVFYDQMGVAVDIFGNMAEKMTTTLPAFGNLIIQMSTFIAKVTEAGSITIFFNTLAAVMERVNKFLSSEFGQTLLRLSAQFLPIIMAVTFVGEKFMWLLKVAFGPIGTLIKIIGGVSTAVQVMAGYFGMAVGPFLAVVAAVAAVIAILVLAYKNSENFRQAISLLIDVVIGALMGAFRDIQGAIKDVFPAFDGLGSIFKDIGDFLAVTLVPILGVVFVRTIGVVSGVIQKLIYTIGGIIEAFKAVWNFVKGIFQLLTGNTEGAAQSMKKSFEGAFNAIKFAIKAIVAPFVAVINAISDAWNNSVGKFDFKIPKWVPIIGGNTYSVPNLPRINLANFAQGGTVQPQAGGMLARIAEAGRAERIEPLDPSGLSVRDRAIIDRLAGPGNGTNINITINPSAGMDERELANIVSRQIAFQLRRGAA